MKQEELVTEYKCLCEVRGSEVRKAGLKLIVGELVGVETIPTEIISYVQTSSTKGNVL